MKLTIAIEETIGNQRVQVRMEVEIFTEGVDRHDDGWDAVRLAKRITQKIAHALMRDTTELLQQSAMKSKVRPQHFWNAKGDVSKRHGCED